MRSALLALLVACGTPPPAASPAPAPAPSAPGSGSVAPVCDGAATKQVLTPDECTCLGGRTNASIGGGAQEHCAAGEAELAPVRFGLEGGWCCQPAT